jgi:hypothetical protein
MPGARKRSNGVLMETQAQRVDKSSGVHRMAAIEDLLGSMVVGYLGECGMAASHPVNRGVVEPQR